MPHSLESMTFRTQCQKLSEAHQCLLKCQLRDRSKWKLIRPDSAWYIIGDVEPEISLGTQEELVQKDLQIGCPPVILQSQI